MNDQSLSQPPFITPEWLRSDLAGAFDAMKPELGEGASLARDDISDPDENAVVLIVSGRGAQRIAILEPFGFAAMFELSRFGGTIGLDHDGKAGAKSPNWYLKVIMPDRPKNNIQVQRLIGNAMPGEIVASAKATPAGGIELRKSFLNKEAGASTKFARQTAVSEALAAAQRHAPEGFDLAGYEANIWSLFEAHDRVE